MRKGVGQGEADYTDKQATRPQYEGDDGNQTHDVGGVGLLRGWHGA